MADTDGGSGSRSKARSGVDEAIVEHARNFVPELRTRSEEIHALGKIPEDLFERIEAAGLLKLSVPRSYGGLEANVKTRQAVLAELGRGDLSTGWVAALMNNAAWGLYALHPKQVIDAISPGRFRGCVAALVSARVRKAPGGYVIEEGQWAFNSGVYHADWDFLPIPLVDEAGNVVDGGFVLLPVKELKILGDWDTMGLRGTGSSGVSARDVFVAEERVTPVSRLLAGEIQAALASAPLYRVAADPLLTISTFSPILGAAQTALEIFLDRLPGRTIHGLQEMKIESAVIHFQIGEISAKIDAADLLIQRAAEELDSVAEVAGETMPKLDRARIRRDVGFAAKLITEAVETLAAAYGASAAGAANPMGRLWRDLRVATLHGLLVPAPGLELYGRLRCGQPAKMAMI
jgi:3-hydroxy-9,10-secoandrosta-1,3,5(10)-triene-9,17-dione monooxygenase